MQRDDGDDDDDDTEWRIPVDVVAVAGAKAKACLATVSARRRVIMRGVIMKESSREMP
jgi:hypothetical protein